MGTRAVFLHIDQQAVRAKEGLPSLETVSLPTALLTCSHFLSGFWEPLGFHPQHNNLIL